ncbi:MAG: ComF family protein [Bdellovibrionales bacterium]
MIESIMSKLRCCSFCWKSLWCPSGICDSCWEANCYRFQIKEYRDPTNSFYYFYEWNKQLEKGLFIQKFIDLLKSPLTNIYLVEQMAPLICRQLYSFDSQKNDIVVPVSNDLVSRKQGAVRLSERIAFLMNLENRLCLVRRRFVAQRSLNRKKRLKISFHLSRQVNDKAILLVDDVVTTGASLRKAKMALNRADSICSLALIYRP